MSRRLYGVGSWRSRHVTRFFSHARRYGPRQCHQHVASAQHRPTRFVVDKSRRHCDRGAHCDADELRPWMAHESDRAGCIGRCRSTCERDALFCGKLSRCVPARGGRRVLRLGGCDDLSSVHRGACATQVRACAGAIHIAGCRVPDFPPAGRAGSKAAIGTRHLLFQRS